MKSEGGSDSDSVSETAGDNNGFFTPNEKIDFSKVDIEPLFTETVIEHPLIALQHCISLRCHTSCKESATPAEEIPELSAGQAEW